MKIHEYQAKEVLAKFGVAVPKNAGVATTAAEAKAKVAELGGTGVIKAQVHTGGRGKAGGIKVAKSPEEAEQYAQAMIGMLLKTHQTPQGIVRGVHPQAPLKVFRGTAELILLIQEHGITASCGL